jgi:hypothetical protein
MCNAGLDEVTQEYFKFPEFLGLNFPVASHQDVTRQFKRNRGRRSPRNIFAELGAAAAARLTYWQELSFRL